MSARTDIRDAIKARLVAGTVVGQLLEGFTVESGRVIPWDDSDPDAVFDKFVLIYADKTPSRTTSGRQYASKFAYEADPVVTVVFGVTAATDVLVETALDAVESAFETLVLGDQTTLDLMREHPLVNSASSRDPSGRLRGLYAVELFCYMPAVEVP